MRAGLPILPSVRSHWFTLHRLVLTAVLFVSFFWVYFQRMGLPVVIPQLEATFGLSAVALGLLGAAYFYPYALMQIPVGVLVDALGARWILTLFVGAAGVGSLLFAWAGSFEEALAGRLLVGIGASAVWLAAQRLFVCWYHPRQFATINGLMNAVGNLGGLTASMPLAVVAAALGWRPAFALVGGILLSMAALCVVVVRDQPHGGAPRPPQKAGSAVGRALPSITGNLRLVLCNREIWLLSAAMLPFVGTRFGFQSLWGGPYMTDVHGLDSAEVGLLLMVMSLAVALSGPIVGYLSDKVFTSRKRFSVLGFSLYTVVWVPLAFATDSVPVPVLYLLVIGMGCGSSFWLTVFAQTKEMYPVALAGTALAVVNFSSTLGGAVYQQAMGVVIGLFEKTGGGYSVSAYSAAFLFCLVSAALSTALVSISKESRQVG